MARMSTSYIGSDALTAPVTSTVPGFDALQPYSYAEPATGVNGTTAASSSSSTSATPSTSSTSSGSASAAQNPYEQQVDTLETWANQYLMQSMSGTPSLDPLYATAGLNADQFANLATELQNLGSPIGGLVSTQA
jgi:hypothetical protein